MIMLSNILQLVLVLVIFIAVLAVTYYVTKWIGKSGMIQNQSFNIRVVETFKIAQNKYIQIIQLGDKYYAISITKDNVTFLTALEEEQLDFTKMENQSTTLPFKDLLDKFSKNKTKNNLEK